MQNTQIIVLRHSSQFTIFSEYYFLPDLPCYGPYSLLRFHNIHDTYAPRLCVLWLGLFKNAVVIEIYNIYFN